METSNRFHPTDPLSLSSPAEKEWASMASERNRHMGTDHTHQGSHQLNKTSPFPKSVDPLQLALFIRHPKSLQALSLLQQIPGIEIVGIAEQQILDREPVQGQKCHNGLGTPSTLLLNQTSPHVLLDFTGDPHTTQTYQLPNTEIPGPYTTLLFEKIVEHKNEIERQMAQIEN